MIKNKKDLPGNFTAFPLVTCKQCLLSLGSTSHPKIF